MKKFSALLLALFLCFFATMPVLADDVLRLVDSADLVDAYDETELLGKLDEISARCGMDVVIVTVDSLGGYTPREYADDFYDYGGYGSDGILLLISMEERDWYISTAGSAIEIFTDARLDYIAESILGDLGEGEYDDAFETFTEMCEGYISNAGTGTNYGGSYGDSYSYSDSEPFSILSSLLVSLLIGFVIALIVVSVLKAQLKSVHKQASAAGYVKRDSLNITRSNDIFLYHTVNRVPRPKQTSSSHGGSSVHRSSSGSFHGGRGGKF